MRQHICKKCGRIYLTDKVDSYFCPPCAAATRSAGTLRERVCKDCGQPFMGYPKSFRCKRCQSEVNKKRSVESKRNGASRKLGSTDLCAACGAPYIVNSGKQRYCPECARTVVADNVRAEKRAWAEEHKEEQAALKAQRRKGRKVCVVCGAVIGLGSPAVTCSPECAAENKRRAQARADVKRGKAEPMRNLFPRGAVNPKSGVPGIHWYSGKWEVRLKGQYIGIYDSIESAKNALDEARESDNKE